MIIDCKERFLSLTYKMIFMYRHKHGCLDGNVMAINLEK